MTLSKRLLTLEKKMTSFDKASRLMQRVGFFPYWKEPKRYCRTINEIIESIEHEFDSILEDECGVNDNYQETDTQAQPKFFGKKAYKRWKLKEITK